MYLSSIRFCSPLQENERGTIFPTLFSPRPLSSAVLANPSQSLCALANIAFPFGWSVPCLGLTFAKEKYGKGTVFHSTYARVISSAGRSWAIVRANRGQFPSEVMPLLLCPAVQSLLLALHG